MVGSEEDSATFPSNPDGQVLKSKSSGEDAVVDRWGRRHLAGQHEIHGPVGEEFDDEARRGSRSGELEGVGRALPHGTGENGALASSARGVHVPNDLGDKINVASAEHCSTGVDDLPEWLRSSRWSSLA
ncbi:MAG: hypothetical protein ACTJGR_05905 [Pauljensenia sp.]